MKPIVICNNCSTGKNYYAKGFCRRCYDNIKYQETKQLKHSQRREWRKNNPEKVKATKSRYYNKYKEIIKIKVSEYQKTPMGKLVMNRKREKRRSKKLYLSESYTTKEWFNKLDNTNGICPGYKCDPHFVGKDKLELDHIYPISKAPKGFNYTIDNVQPLCKSCNTRKGTKVSIYDR